MSTLIEYLGYKREDDTAFRNSNIKLLIEKVKPKHTLRSRKKVAYKAMRYLEGWHPEISADEYKRILIAAGHKDDVVHQVFDDYLKDFEERKKEAEKRRLQEMGR